MIKSRPYPAAVLSVVFTAAIAFGEQAPVFHLDDAEGHSFDLAAHLGKDVIVLDFWATFCVPCLSELETYRKIQLQHQDQGFVVAAISVDQPQTAARVRSFARTRAFPFPVLLDPGQEAYRLYGVAVLPTSVIIDRQGRIAYRKEGFEPGDEKELDRRLSELLTPAVGDSSQGATAKIAIASAPAKEIFTGLSLSGSNFMRANYGKANPADSISNGWLEDWFDFRLAGDKLSYQARFRDYEYLRDSPGLQDNLILNPTDRVVKQTFAYESDHEDIRAGNYYGNLNRGLVLQMFEDRQARIDKDMLGVWASLNGEPVAGLGHGRISVFGGKTFSSFTDLYTLDATEETSRNTYLQGLEGEWDPHTGLKLGAQYVEAFRTNWHARLAGGNVEWLQGPTTLYLGYVGLNGQDNVNYPNDYHGRALYGALSENIGKLEVGGEYKYYYNYDLGFTEPPSLVKYHTFRLMARDILFPNNQREQGGQVHATWRFHDQDFYSLNLSDIVSHPERNPELLIHHVDLPYVDLDQSLQLSGPDRSSILLDADWNRQRKFELPSFQDVNAFSLGATGTKPLQGPWTLQGELEVQRRFVDSLALLPPDASSGLGGVGGVYSFDNPWEGVASATLVRNSFWTFTLDYEFMTSSVGRDWKQGFLEIHSPSKPLITNGWTSAYLTYSALEGNQISLWLGQRQERVICSGGSCRLEPAFDGAELIWISHF